MSTEADIEVLRGQEASLVFDRFDEVSAMALGGQLVGRAEAEGLALVVDIRFWDRPLFYCALPGTNADNPHWVRRKAFIVQRLGKSSYRALLDNGGDKLLPAHRGLDPADYALAGGSFPIRIAGVGIVGAITVSGLPERHDHALVVDAICDFLGVARHDHALPER